MKILRTWLLSSGAQQSDHEVLTDALIGVREGVNEGEGKQPRGKFSPPVCSGHWDPALSPLHVASSTQPQTFQGTPPVPLCCCHYFSLFKGYLKGKFHQLLPATQVSSRKPSYLTGVPGLLSLCLLITLSFFKEEMPEF